MAADRRNLLISTFANRTWFLKRWQHLHYGDWKVECNRISINQIVQLLHL